MTEQHPTSTDVPARNQRPAEPAAAGTTEEAPAVDDVSPETPPRPEAGAHRSGAPSGEVAPQ